MGIYVFMDVLMEVLRSFPDRKMDDFGGDIIPLIAREEEYRYNFEGYWHDIGTIQTFRQSGLTEDAQSSIL